MVFTASIMEIVAGVGWNDVDATALPDGSLTLSAEAIRTAAAGTQIRRMVLADIHTPVFDGKDLRTGSLAM
jgi:hypothetical protein